MRRSCLPSCKLSLPRTSYYGSGEPSSCGCDSATQFENMRRLSLALAYLCGVSECIFHSVPDMAGNFYTVSARPGHERNLIVPDFAAYRRDRVAEGEDRFWIPRSGSRLEFS